MISAASGCPDVNVDPSINLAKIGLNYHFGDAPWKPRCRLRRPLLPESDDWNVHAQTTFLPRAIGRVPLALYRSQQPSRRRAGAGDLDHDGIPRRTAVAGRRVLFQPRAGAGIWHRRHARRRRLPERRSAEGRRADPKIRPQRYYFKQTFGLGGEQEDVDDGPNQLPASATSTAITVIIGRFAIGDFFDNNSYAHDPRADFMNWAMWASAA